MGWDWKVSWHSPVTTGPSTEPRPVSSLHLPYGTGSLEGRAVLRELPIHDSLAHTAVHIEFLGGRKLL